MWLRTTGTNLASAMRLSGQSRNLYYKHILDKTFTDLLKDL